MHQEDTKVTGPGTGEAVSKLEHEVSQPPKEYRLQKRLELTEESFQKELEKDWNP